MYSRGSTKTCLTDSVALRNDLERRRKCLNAQSVLHLCKSIVMENTKVEEDIAGCPKYCCVIVQVSTF